MNEASLRELLSRIHDRLRKAGSVDPESRKLLAEVMDDIDRVLRAEKGGSKKGERHAPRLETLAVQFEADHPALAQQLRQLADVLGKAGI
jgi:predicted component of type VI protein secretion system